MIYTYSAAISFLSADEGVALKLRDGLKTRLELPVFVYQDRQREMCGRSLEEALSAPFESESRIAVVLYRPGWGTHGGTLVEKRAIVRRRLRSEERFLFPVVLEHNSARPPWSEELIYFDLAKYGLDQAIDAIASLAGEHTREHPASTETSPHQHLAPLAHRLKPALCAALRTAFVTIPGPFQGYFGGAETSGDSTRWQSRGGEGTTSTEMPKRPYYQTYWGYEAMLRLQPTLVGTWAPITIEAVSRHFGESRWLHVVREYAFSSGPRKSPPLAQSVRHTARAAELLHLLEPRHRRVSQVAWDLLDQSPFLQQVDGGWREFCDGEGSSALWSTVYVHRFLSKLKLLDDIDVPDERNAFLATTAPLLLRSARFLAEQWARNRWELEGTVSWDEGTAAVLAEVGPFISDDSLILDAYSALRSLLTPAGRLSALSRQPTTDRPPESLLATRIAFGLRNCGRGLSEADSRYRRLREWLSEELVASNLTVYDIAFAAAVLDLQADPAAEHE